MAQGQTTITTVRDGNWSRPQQYHDSPWWASDEEAETGFVPGDGWTVVVKHALTVDADAIVGLSLQSQIWSPLAVSTSAGSATTNLASGSYVAAAEVMSSAGRTWIGNTSTASFVIANGASKPRITFAEPPPAGCEYWLFLSSPNNLDARPVAYCTGITGTTVDLVGGSYANAWSAGVASGGTTTFGNTEGLGSPYQCNALTIQASGSIVVVAGKRFLVRGDVEIQSAPGVTKPYITTNSGSDFKIDPSQADVPAYDLYRLLMSGDGDIRMKG